MLSIASVAVLLLGTSCGSAPKRIDPAGNQGLTTVNAIDAKDWQNAAVVAINSMIESGVLIREDGRKSIVMISQIKNSTQNQKINTRLLTDKMRTSMLRSGKAVVTTAVGANGAEDKATRQVRDLENDDLFNQKTVQKRGTVLSPDLSLSGEITQEYRKVGRTEESYFLFHIVLTDISTGLAIWEENAEVSKQGTKSIFE